MASAICAPSELENLSKTPLLCLGDKGEVFYELALAMIDTISDNNRQGRETAIICPVGPTGQYPVFVRLVNRDGISLKNCLFINMDEYLNDDGDYIDISSPLSFRGYMRDHVYAGLRPDLLMDESRRIFPDPSNPSEITDLLEAFGGADLVIGGAGINGHIAFNEPQPELSNEQFMRLGTRALDIAEATRATNAAGSLDGDLSQMPRRCVTVGMSDILAARKIRIGLFRDWQAGVLRRYILDGIDSGFPLSFLKTHPDTQILASRNVWERTAQMLRQP